MMRPPFLALLRIAMVLGLAVPACWAAAAEANEPLPSNAEGQELASRLRHGWPEEDMAVSGVLKIRERGQPTRRVPVQFFVRQGANAWQAIYNIQAAEGITEEKLVITHTPGITNRYEYHQGGKSHPSPSLFTPLAGSDFWIVDLGLDFLHWPGQRLVETEMRKGRWCRVLESSRPPGVRHGYQRVISWLDKEHGQPILAEAYDARNELLKEFSIGSFKKVDGQWRLEDMKIVNVQKRSRTELEFDLE